MAITLPSLTLGVLLGDPRLPYEYGPEGSIGEEQQHVAHEVRWALSGVQGLEVHYYDEHERLIDELREAPPELVLNLCDNGYRNRLHLEPSLPALLELLEIPYTGSTAMCMGLARDKGAVHCLAAMRGVPVPNERIVDLRADPLPLPERYPAIIKPNAASGSVGVEPEGVVHDDVAAQAYLERLAGELEGPWALVQDFLPGEEYTVGVIGNPGQGLTVLPPLAIDYSGLDTGLPPILSYGSKTDPDSPYYRELRFRPAALDMETRARLVEAATSLFTRFGARDCARVDFRTGADGVPRLLDFNSRPSCTPDGKLALMAGYAGYSYADLLALVIRAALARYAA